MQKTKCFILVLILALTLSCKKSSTGSLYIPVSDDATPTATIEELQQGRTLYINNCGRCHDLYSPDDYTVNQWRGIMPGMAPKTRMSSSEVTLVTKYVTRGQ
jgi:mono/diheme cytochrome c family protein